MLAPVIEDPLKNQRRRTWPVLCLGIIFGFAGASFRGPWLVSLLFKPLQDSLSCAPSVNQALTQFVGLQLSCAVLGGVVALLSLFFWRRYLRQRAEAKLARNAPG